MKRTNLTVRWLRPLSLVVFSLLLAELFLRALGLAIPQVHALVGPRRTATRVIQHPVLGYIGNPEFFEHDDRGFRNAGTVQRAQIVTLGDSNTYGTGVESVHAWPATLARRLGVTVYNMGLGSYGASHNAENLAIALSLKPDLVIFALYLGNDFYDDFRFALQGDRLASVIPREQAEVATRLERDSSLVDEVEFLFKIVAKTNESGRTGVGSLKRGARWLPEHIRLIGLIRAFKIQLAGQYESALLSRDFNKARSSLTDRQREFVSVFEGAEWKTLLTSRYKFKLMDDSDPRIRSGIEVTKYMLQQMRDRVGQAGADFLVLLIPTKEYVFWPKVERSADHPQLEMLVATADKLRLELKDFLRAKGIPYVDPAPALRSADEQPYFPNGDGHPNRQGHDIIVQALLSHLHRP